MTPHRGHGGTLPTPRTEFRLCDDQRHAVAHALYAMGAHGFPDCHASPYPNALARDASSMTPDSLASRGPAWVASAGVGLRYPGEGAADLLVRVLFGWGTVKRF